MKILIATGIYPPDIGGPATIIRALSLSLKKNGIGVGVITYAEEGGRYKENGIEVLKISKNGNKFFYHLNYFFRLAGLAKNADILYATDLYSVGYFAYLLNRIWGKKYILRFAGDSAWETAVSSGETSDYIVDFQEKKYSSRIEKLKERRRKILASADRVIAVSNFLAGIAERIGVPRDKIEIIYNSIDFLDYPENDLEAGKIKQKYGENKKIIITVCRLTKWKGIDSIIKILPELAAKSGDIRFLILGDGPEMARLKELAKNIGVGEKVEFLGKIEHGKVFDYLKAADLFILNTNYEGLSHVILEAMKAGAPVVATNIGGNPEVITNGEEGFLVAFDNRQKLLEACLKILEDRNLAEKFIKNSREKLKQFNWEENIKKTIKVINEIKADA